MEELDQELSRAFSEVKVEKANDSESKAKEGADSRPKMAAEGASRVPAPGAAKPAGSSEAATKSANSSEAERPRQPNAGPQSSGPRGAAPPRARNQVRMQRPAWV